MTQTPSSPLNLASTADVQRWRDAWMGALSSWHSPYKVLVDCGPIRVENDPSVVKSLDLMVRFFNGFFLRSIVGFGRQEGLGHDLLPFPVFDSLEEASSHLGLRVRGPSEPTDFRSTIQLQNHFQQHTVELTFSQPVVIKTAEELATLRSKLSNNLMQWHSKWSLLVDCTHLEIDPAAKPAMERLLTVLKGLFMKTAIGYSPCVPSEQYPFPVYRSRHRAAAILTGEGNFSGDQADCKSKKST